MPQLSLYINDEDLQVLRRSAQETGVSMSKYAAKLIREDTQRSRWPNGYWESVYGCLAEGDLDIVEDDLHAELDDACDWFEGVA